MSRRRDASRSTGPNEPAPVHRLSALRQLLQLFANPLVIILLVAGALSGALGQRADAPIIVTIVLLGVTINFWQTYRSTAGRRAPARVRGADRDSPARRDVDEVPLRDVVPGDLFRLSAGDMVPADARLLESRDLVGPAVDADRRVAAGRQACGRDQRRRRRRPAPTIRTLSSWARRS